MRLTNYRPPNISTRFLINFQASGGGVLGGHYPTKPITTTPAFAIYTAQELCFINFWPSEDRESVRVQVLGPNLTIYEVPVRSWLFVYELEPSLQRIRAAVYLTPMALTCGRDTLAGLIEMRYMTAFTTTASVHLIGTSAHTHAIPAPVVWTATEPTVAPASTPAPAAEKVYCEGWPLAPATSQ